MSLRCGVPAEARLRALDSTTSGITGSIVADGFYGRKHTLFAPSIESELEGNRPCSGLTSTSAFTNIAAQACAGVVRRHENQ